MLHAAAAKQHLVATGHDNSSNSDGNSDGSTCLQRKPIGREVTLTKQGAFLLSMPPLPVSISLSHSAPSMLLLLVLPAYRLVDQSQLEMYV